MHSRSVYEEHSLGETYRAGVAYLRARTEEDDRAPRRVGDYSVTRQREFIARAARAERVIIVAEYIEYGDEAGYQPAFLSAMAFISETQVSDLFVAREEYVTRRRGEFPLFRNYLTTSQVRLIPAIDG